MKDYYELLEKVLVEGNQRGDRTGTGAIGLFGQQMKFDISKSFPLLTGKQTSFKMIATELLWFLQGNPNIDYLHEHGNKIWENWVKEDNTFGPIYGKQWRLWGDLDRIVNSYGDTERYGVEGIDQIQNVIDRLKSDPLGRRHIVSAWNVVDVESGEMALPPCHVLFQFYARELKLVERKRLFDGNFAEYCLGKITEGNLSDQFNRILDTAGVSRYALSCQLYQRSADMFLGVPYNIASYSLLTYMIAQLTNMVPEEFIWAGGDCHIYSNHVSQVRELLSRRQESTKRLVAIPPLPTLEINSKIDHIDKFTLNDFNVIGYEPLSSIKAPIAV